VRPLEQVRRTAHGETPDQFVKSRRKRRTIRGDVVARAVVPIEISFLRESQDVLVSVAGAVLQKLGEVVQIVAAHGGLKSQAQIGKASLQFPQAATTLLYALKISWNSSNVIVQFAHSIKTEGCDHPGTGTV
jgi:hypothetical protein